MNFFNKLFEGSGCFQFPPFLKGVTEKLPTHELFCIIGILHYGRFWRSSYLITQPVISAEAGIREKHGFPLSRE